MAKAAGDPTERFFETLAAYGHAPLLRKASGVTRFDIVEGKRASRWFVSVDKGDLTVSRRGSGEPDCVIRAEKVLFDRIASGKVNPVAAVLRGDVTIDGDWRLLVWMQRMFPGPPRRRQSASAGYARRRG
jgi:hypothetical protein